MILFIQSHRLALQTRADGLSIKERELILKVQSYEAVNRRVKAITGNVMLALTLTLSAFGVGAIAGVNAPESVACDRQDPVCKVVRVRPKVFF